jgi:hypothetical protein
VFCDPSLTGQQCAAGSCLQSSNSNWKLPALSGPANSYGTCNGEGP